MSETLTTKITIPIAKIKELWERWCECENDEEMDRVHTEWMYEIGFFDAMRELDEKAEKIAIDKFINRIVKGEE